MFYSDLVKLFVYFICAIIISLIAFLISYIFGIRADDSNKIMAYECGFTPFADARNTFEIHFYLVGILFLMFDLFVSYLYPWSVSLFSLSEIGFLTMSVFFVFIALGYYYQSTKGALEWN